MSRGYSGKIEKGNRKSSREKDNGLDEALELSK